MAVICSEFVRGGVVLRLKCVLRSNWCEMEIYLHIYANNNTMRGKVKIRHCRNISKIQ